MQNAELKALMRSNGEAVQGEAAFAVLAAVAIGLIREGVSPAAASRLVRALEDEMQPKDSHAFADLRLLIGQTVRHAAASVQHERVRVGGRQ